MLLIVISIIAHYTFLSKSVLVILLGLIDRVLRQLGGAELGLYYRSSSTRSVVADNFNRIRRCFGLSTQKLNELMNPILAIPYTRSRRLAAGSRDITAQELLALYELLGVPPTTFLYPWSIPKTKRTASLYEEAAKNNSIVPLPERFVSSFPNPIFDHIGTGVLPYRFTKLHNWLVGQSILCATSNSGVLYSLTAVGEGERFHFQNCVSSALDAYVRKAFSIEEYADALHRLYSSYPIYPDGRLNLTDYTDFLRCFSGALVEMMHREVFINLYSQITLRDGDNTIFGSQMEHEDYDAPMLRLLRDDAANGPLVLLIGYTEQIPFTIMARLSRPAHEDSEILTLRAVREDGSEITSVDAPFPYADWFSMPLPAPIKPLQDKQGLIWENNLRMELVGDLYNHQKPFSYRRFDFLHPKFDLLTDDTTPHMPTV